MSVYVVAEVEVNDESWIPEYAKKVHNIVDHYGGKYLARSANIVDLEGQSLPATLMAILEFPDAASVEAFATSAEYAPFATARQAGTVSRLRMIDGTDVAGTIPYLEKG